MAKHWFYIAAAPQTGHVALDAENTKHAIQVLRLKAGDAITLTDGKGNAYEAVIREAAKRNCAVEILDAHFAEFKGRRVAMAVSPLKNTARFEWFLEKASELGIAEIFPVHCEHTVRGNLRLDRCRAICVSAMLQSQQTWLTRLHDLQPLENMLALNFDQQWIAHCAEAPKAPLSEIPLQHNGNGLLLIGPEGDFSPREIDLFTEAGFVAVGLGEARLRTETAAIAGAVLLRLG